MSPTPSPFVTQPANQQFNYLIALLQIFVPIALGFLSGLVGVSFGLGKYKTKVDSLERKVGKLEEKTDDHSTKITECAIKIDERTRSYASTLTKTGSPVVLSEMGDGLLKESGSDKFVLENKEELVGLIKKRSPKTAYDVQIYANEVVRELKDDERFTKFKDFVYGRGIELKPVFIVMGIYLRDIALPLLGFTIKEVDKDDPKIKKKRR